MITQCRRLLLPFKQRRKKRPPLLSADKAFQQSVTTAHQLLCAQHMVPKPAHISLPTPSANGRSYLIVSSDAISLVPSPCTTPDKKGSGEPSRISRAYCIAPNFRGAKFSRFSRIHPAPRKLSSSKLFG